MASDDLSAGPPDTVDVRLDLRHLRCPMPLLKTRQQLRQMRAGQWLKVEAMDPGAKRDIPAWLRQTSHRLVQSAEENGVISFTILVGEGG